MPDIAYDRERDLVSSSDVNGTAVCNRAGKHVGTIDQLMIDKHSGQVFYAIMTFGGFLGFGEEEFLIPWTALHYDKGAHGFMTDVLPAQLEAAPQRPDNWHQDREYEKRLHDLYQTRYWL
ncbi:MAG: PRC-barrel domain-containing protein [Paracoccaceae bacterium]